MFIHPEMFKHFKVSAGLAHITAKKATDIAHDTLTILKRYGIKQEDLFRPVNVCCTGRKADCWMHKCELITKHAMSQPTRKCNKQVVDSFPEMEMFGAKIRKLVTWIIDTKQKSKYKQYANFVEALMNGKQPLKLETLNDTRDSGTIMMYQSILRSYWDLHYYM